MVVGLETIEQIEAAVDEMKGEVRLQDLQDEYFQILSDFKMDGTQDSIYKRRRLRELQLEIINIFRWLQDKSLETTRKELQETFTPGVIEDLKENNE